MATVIKPRSNDPNDRIEANRQWTVTLNRILKDRTPRHLRASDIALNLYARARRDNAGSIAQPGTVNTKVFEFSRYLLPVLIVAPDFFPYHFDCDTQLLKTECPINDLFEQGFLTMPILQGLMTCFEGRPTVGETKSRLYTLNQHDLLMLKMALG